MSNDHVVELLDRVPVSHLAGDERDRVERHAATCASCARALEAARLGDELLEARAGVVVEPSPFFQTRVMAAVRERMAGGDERSLSRIWRASRALVSAMAASVILLAGAAYVSSPSPQSDAAASPIYSSEWRAIESPEAGSTDISDDQLVAILYDSEGAYGQGR